MAMAQSSHGPDVRREMFVPEKAGDQLGISWFDATGYATECDDDLTVNRRGHRRRCRTGSAEGRGIAAM